MATVKCGELMLEAFAAQDETKEWRGRVSVVVMGGSRVATLSADEAEIVGHNLNKLAAMSRGKANSANRRPKTEEQE